MSSRSRKSGKLRHRTCPSVSPLILKLQAKHREASHKDKALLMLMREIQTGIFTNKLERATSLHMVSETLRFEEHAKRLRSVHSTPALCCYRSLHDVTVRIDAPIVHPLPFSCTLSIKFAKKWLPRGGTKNVILMIQVPPDTPYIFLDVHRKKKSRGKLSVGEHRSPRKGNDEEVVLPPGILVPIRRTVYRRKRLWEVQYLPMPPRSRPRFRVSRKSIS